MKIFLQKIFFITQADLENFWFEETLKEYKPNNLITIKNFPLQFGFENNHLKISKKLIENFDFNYFDLIIDNQTRLKNTFIYRKIPHKYFISPSLNYLFSKPLFFTKKKKNLLIRLLFYLDKITRKKSIPNYKIKIPEKFAKKAMELLPNDKKYIGFSITAGHPTRIKEISIQEIIKVANHYSKDFIPTFFIEDKYLEIKEHLKTEINNSFFPEENIEKEFKKPMLVTAMGALTEFNITIDNGISHMLSFSNSKNYIFFNKSSEKFKPSNNNSAIYDCEKTDKNIDKLTSEEIINFIVKN
jgi:ADP-heptose:LPS heptosyltransferase